MRRYADPHRCPDCGQPIVPDAGSCPNCGLPLRGQTGQDLYVALLRADQLLGVLRGATTPAPTASAPVPAPPQVTQSTPAVSVSAPRTGVRTASVPQILLGLGAACLLVAAVVFLAVAWSVMGVGGRTATLVGLTVATGALAGWVAKRDLRGAAEALGAVTLGLLALDVLGAAHAGWFGTVSTPSTTMLVGGVLGLAGASAALLARRTPVNGLVAGEIAAALGVGFVAAGVMASAGDGAVRALIATLVSGAATFAAYRLRLPASGVGSGVISGLCWLLLALAGFERVDPAVVSPAWGDLDVWPLLAAAVIGAGVAALRVPQWLRVIGAGAAAAALACAVTAPSFDESVPVLVANGLAVGLVAAAMLAYLPRRWSAAATGLALAGALAGVGAVTSVGGQALSAVLDAWDLDADRFAGTTEPGWLIPAGLLTLVALCVGTLIAIGQPLRTTMLIRGAAVPAAAGAALMIPSYNGPVWSWVLALVVLALTALILDWLSESAVAFALALLSASTDPRLLAAALIAALLGCVAVMLRRGRGLLWEVCGGTSQLLLGWLTLVAGDLVGASVPWVAAVGIVLVLAVPLAAHRVADDPIGVELGGAVAAMGLFVAGAMGLDQPWTWVAVYLTLAGVVVGVTALLRADRRDLGWVAGALLATATWVQLADLGVRAPEPYTLPSALVLLLIGWWRLRRDPSASTFATLGPGLGLALVPSLVWVIADPLTVRALLLGLACLLLVLAGAQARLAAPLVLGAAAAVVLLIVELAPYSQAVPRWALIGTAGVLLVGLGVTWEARVRQARALTAYVERLR